MTRTLTARRLAAVAAPVLLAASLTACGGGASGSPEDASTEEFCGVVNGTPDGEDADAAHDYADKLKDVGTPSEINGDAREGFEILVDKLADISDDDIKKFDESEDGTDVFDEDDVDKVTAYFTKQFELCPAELPDVPDVEVPTDVPS